MKIKFEKGENYNIPFGKVAKLKTYKNFKEVVYIKHKANNLKYFKPRKGKKFINLKTGEIKSYSQCENFKSNKSLKRTLNGRVKDLLMYNFEGGRTEKFLTLTFDNINVEFKDLTRIFNNFWNRLKRYYQKKGLSFICLYVKEVHQNGNWHFHILLKEINGKNLFLDFNDIKKIWGFGGVHINPVSSNIDNFDENIDIEQEIASGFAPQIHSFNRIVDYMCKLKSKENVIPTFGRAYGTKGTLRLPDVTFSTYTNIYSKHLKKCHLNSQKTILLRNADTNSIINTIHKEKWINDNKNRL